MKNGLQPLTERRLSMQLKILSMKMMMLDESQIRYQQRQAVEVV